MKSLPFVVVTQQEPVAHEPESLNVTLLSTVGCDPDLSSPDLLQEMTKL